MKVDPVNTNYSTRFMMERSNNHPANPNQSKNPPDLSYLSHQNNYYSNSIRQKNRSDRIHSLMKKSKMQVDHFSKLNEMKSSPYYQQLYKSYKSQKSQYQTELARILNEECNERNPKKQKPDSKEQPKQVIINGQRYSESEMVDQSVIEHMRRDQQRQQNYGAKLQKLCYAVPTFKEKLFENIQDNNYNF